MSLTQLSALAQEAKRMQAANPDYVVRIVIDLERLTGIVSRTSHMAGEGVTVVDDLHARYRIAGCAIDTTELPDTLHRFALTHKGG